MILVHTTLSSRWSSIRVWGILTSYARGRRPAVWLHLESSNVWAEEHVRTNHDAAGDDLVHVTVNVPDEWVKQHAGDLFYCLEDILPDRFLSVVEVRTVRETISL
jgi:hypothetical protein